MPNRLKIDALRLLIGLLLLIFSAVFAPFARAADSAPDWLRTAAKETLSNYPPETVAVVLLDEQQTTVKADGQIETLHRQAVRILRPEAREDFGYLGVTFDSDTKLSYMKTWTITPDGHELATKATDVLERSAYDADLYTDVRIQGLKLLEVNPGSIVGYEYLQKGRPFIFEDRWNFQHRVPVHVARFVLQLPPGWELSTQWINYPDGQQQDLPANRHVWEVSDVPGIEAEPAMPAWQAIAGRMGVKYFPNDPTLRAKTNASWKDIGTWYNSLTQNRRVATPEIRQKVAELTSGLTDPVAKMSALTEYVQRQVRYFGIEIGIGGYQPHFAGEVFAHQYGDCKDKATLLSAMLQEIGIQSYYMIINTRRGVARPDYPSINFNHVILAIPLSPETSKGPFFATLNHPTLGRLLFFDPTNEYVPLGYLPSYLQDSHGLVVTPDGGELLSLPLLPPSTNRLLRTGTFSVTASGDLSGEVREMTWGGPAADGRQRFLAEQPAKRAQIFENFLGTFLNNFTLTNASIGNLESGSDMLSLQFKFLSQGYARNAGDLLILRPRIIGEKQWAILEGKPRKYPIQFEETTRQDDVFDIVLPPGYVVDELPPPASAQCEYASYKSEVRVSDGTLHYKRTYEISDITVPTLKLAQLKTFFEQIAADESSSVVLRKANP